MIVSCNQCKKNFEVNSSLIPESGRLLQCSSCNHQWFYKKKLAKSEEIISSTLNDKTDENIEIINEDIPLLEEKITKNDNIEKKFTKSEKNYNNVKSLLDKNQSSIRKKNDLVIENNKKKISILSVTLIFIISFIALLIVIETFKEPISLYVPNIDFLLINLYETIKDSYLFFKDLITNS